MAEKETAAAEREGGGRCKRATTWRRPPSWHGPTSDRDAVEEHRTPLRRSTGRGGGVGGGRDGRGGEGIEGIR